MICCFIEITNSNVLKKKKKIPVAIINKMLNIKPKNSAGTMTILYLVVTIYIYFFESLKLLVEMSDVVINSEEKILTLRYCGAPMI